MSNNMQAIDLPNADDMLQRLKGVSDDPHFIQWFYPLILQSAGKQEVFGIGVVSILQSAIADYVDRDPTVGAFLRMEMLVPHYLEALIDDKKVLSDALEVHNATKVGTSKGS